MEIRVFVVIRDSHAVPLSSTKRQLSCDETSFEEQGVKSGATVVRGRVSFDRNRCSERKGSTDDKVMPPFMGSRKH